MHRLGNAALINIRSVMVQKYPCAENRILVTSYEYQHKPILTIFGRSPIGNSTCVRAQSSTPTAENSLLKKRKRRRFRDSRFVELLQVTDSATKQITTKVENLKSQNLSNFVLNSDLPPSKRSEHSKKSNKKGLKQPIEYQKINLEMFDTCTMQTGAYDERPMIFVGKNCNQEETKIDEILQSFHNFKEIIDGIKDEYQDENAYCESKVLDEKLDEELGDPIEDIHNTETDTPAVSFNNTRSKQKSQKFNSKNYTTEANEKMAKHKSLMINLTAYLNVCISVGTVQRGSNTLLYYRDKYKKLGNNPNLIGIEPYNIILHGYAATGNHDKMYGLCKIIQADEIPFNCQTFAALFECLGRAEPSEGSDNLIRKYRNNAERMNFTLNDILDKSKFQYDQREIVLDAIRRIEPDFTPIYTPPDLAYCNPLLESLNKYVKDFKCGDNSELTENSGNKIMNSKRGFTKAQLQEFAEHEIKKELDGYLAVESVEKQQTAHEPTSAIYKTKFEELQKTWRTQICAAINRNLNILRAQNRYKPQEVMTYYIYLKTLNPSQYADIILREIRILAEGSETYSPALTQLYRELGEKVYAKYQIEHKKNNGTLNKIGEIYSQYCEQWEKSITSDNSRQIWQRLLHENQSWGPSMDLNETVWPRHVLYNIGRFLYNVMMRDIKIDANITRTQGKIKSQNRLPAFYTVFRNQGKTVKQEIKPHPILSRLLRLSQQKNLFFDASLVPMLCPPQPWTTPVNGGYLLKNSELIRLPHQAVQQWNRINESDSRQLYPALDSLNQLGSIAWRVNTDVLDVILEVFRNGGDEKLDVPKPPSSLPPLPSISYKDASLSNAERYQIFKDKLIRRRRQGEMYSLWCDTLYRLSLANHYRDKVFWLPHNMDFRGRVYPIPPHLNHLGSDLARSMLVFDQAQPLGVDGFSWLKLHCINLTGLKKRDSIRERLLYAERIMDDIIDSADHPLTGRMWWTKSDEPWQTLSCCIEIAKVARCPEPEKYMCHLPIHQDGSCNGLQHYAALGRDTAGAFSVNLASSTVPQDVYSSVAALVEKSRESDADNGLHVAQILKGYVRRKVIKQTVMTTVYGVTKHGARLQIAKQLKDIDDFPKDWVWPASTYLTTKTFESLREMFTSTKEIQDWFTECARLISSVCSENVEWITPLGLPVVQPYSRFDSRSQFDKTGSKIKEHFHMDMFTKPNVMKQKNAFPPNFIHSLDSSHMMLTSLFCERKGITFVSVHDCFWTHACTVPDMNKICREQFVALHSQAILEDLSKFLVQKYSFIEKEIKDSKKSADISKQKLNKLLQKVPQKGKFDLKKVLESVYFFS